MRTLIVGAMVSMDGVMQVPRGPTEDLTKGFINYVTHDGVMQSPGAFQ